MAKYRVDVGKEFAVVAVEVEDIGEVERLAGLAFRMSEARRRSWLSTSVLVAGFIALACAACFGALDGSFNELDVIWKIVAGPMGLALYPALRSKAGIVDHGENSH